MNKSVYLGLFCILCLYLLWVWAVLAAPPFADIADWPKTDFDRTSIKFAEIIEAGPGKDDIRSIDQPKFVSLDVAEEWLDARDPVIAFSHEGEVRAYPLQILMYHEIVNDDVAGLPIAVTYCPLCNAAMVFSRKYENNLLEFGVSGKTYNNNLMMYDRQTESWWLQFTGTGIVGQYTNASLTLLPSQIVSFHQFQASHPNGLVLSKETGFNRKYGVNPYTNYDSRNTPMPWFYGKPFDHRLPAMERVLGVVLNETAVAFPLTKLNESALVQLEIASEPVLVIGKSGMASAVDKKIIKESKDVLAALAFSRQIDGRVLDFELNKNVIIDVQTHSVWNMFGQAVSGDYKGAQLVQVDRGVYFSFVWLDFYPRSTIFGLK